MWKKIFVVEDYQIRLEKCLDRWNSDSPNQNNNISRYQGVQARPYHSLVEKWLSFEVDKNKQSAVSDVQSASLDSDSEPLPGDSCEVEVDNVLSDDPNGSSSDSDSEVEVNNANGMLTLLDSDSSDSHSEFAGF